MEGGISMPTAFTTVLSQVWSGISGVVTTITESPLLLIPVGMAFAAGVIGLAKGLMGARRGRRR